MAFSYQHEYHAGNHADVLKHITLTLLLESLCKKEKPFTVIDSHASAGRFFLNDERLEKTSEAKGGILKLKAFLASNDFATLPAAIQSYLLLQKPYLEQGLYAGSVEIERLFLRTGDKHFAIEKHPQAVQALQKNVREPLFTAKGKIPAAEKTTVLKKDSYEALKALTPPLIKRGLILIDPSFEEKSDYERVLSTIKAVFLKWHTATIALWYPLLLRRKNETAQLISSLEDFIKLQPRVENRAETYRAELEVFTPSQKDWDVADKAGSHLYGSGMFIINPPYKLQEKLAPVLPVLKNMGTSKNCNF